MSFPDYPFTSRHLDRDGIHLHYLDEGPKDAPPLLMLHGNPTWSFFFRKPILALRDRYRCIVPDHIGMGLSDKPDDRAYDHVLARRIDDVSALVEHLQIERDITLILHDWGGAIGMGYAARNPQHIARLILMNTAAFGLPDDQSVPWQLKLCRTPGLGPLLVRGFNGFCRYALRHCATHPLAPDVAAAYLAPYDNWSNRRAVLRFVQDIPLRPSHPSHTALAAITTALDQFRAHPALVCWGMQDFVFNEGFLEQWQRHLPEAQFHRFPDAGHYLLEDAGEQVLPLIDQFLSDHPLR
ncbi:MAG: alpha/beta fold hydrolase [Phycisphaerae bacterium]|nr:alpha/beta fold hydrolase [Phycisphaerae bacterium]